MTLTARTRLPNLSWQPVTACRQRDVDLRRAQALLEAIDVPLQAAIRQARGQGIE